MSFKLYMLSIMKDKRRDLLALAIKAVLSVLSWLYLLGIKIVDFSYKLSLRKTYKAEIPVISVGNIALGGTGKTPFTIYIADYLTNKGKKCAVLTRGYGKDEYKQIRETLPDVEVFVGQNRSKSALAAYKNGNEIIVMDDGFQHRKLERDLNIVLLDGKMPFGNGKLFPRGVLREGVDSLKRTDLIVITKIDSAKDDPIKKIKEVAPNIPVVTASHKASFIKDVTGAIYSLDTVKGVNTSLVSGIVDPEYFNKMVKDIGANVTLDLTYDDHHQYNQRDILDIYTKSAKNKCERIIITEKDYVKLRKLDLSGIEGKLFILCITIQIESGKENLLAGLNSVINS